MLSLLVSSTKSMGRTFCILFQVNAGLIEDMFFHGCGSATVFLSLFPSSLSVSFTCFHKHIFEHRNVVSC